MKRSLQNNIPRFKTYLSKPHLWKNLSLKNEQSESRQLIRLRTIWPLSLSSNLKLPHDDFDFDHFTKGLRKRNKPVKSKDRNQLVSCSSQMYSTDSCSINYSVSEKAVKQFSFSKQNRLNQFHKESNHLVKWVNEAS